MRVCLILFFAHKICVSVLFQSGRLCNDIDYFCAERGEASFGVVFAMSLRVGEGREGLWSELMRKRMDEGGGEKGEGLGR